MKKYLLLPLVALGLVAWVPNQAKAGVHVSVGFGAPAYYGPYYGPYYPSYYYGPTGIGGITTDITTGTNGTVGKPSLSRQKLK